MVESYDEVSTAYGLLAESVSYPDDFSWATYRLRQEARWHDGKPVTPEDVVFSLDILKKQSPMYIAYYQHVVKAEKVGERDVKFTFDAPGNRELPSIVGPTQRPAQALVGRDRQFGQEARYHRRPRSRPRSAMAPIASRVSRSDAGSSTSA